MSPAAAALGAALGLASVAVAVAAAVVSRLEWRPGPLVLPWGLGLAVIGSASVVALCRGVARGHGIVAAGGWIIGAGLVLVGRPEGDYAIGSDYLGYGFLLGATAVVIVAAGYGRPSR